MAAKTAAVSPPVARSRAERKAEEKRRIAEARATLSAELLAAEQRETAAKVAHARSIETIAAEVAAEELRCSIESSKRALAALAGPYRKAVASGYDLLVCGELQRVFAAENDEHARITGRALDHELDVLCAQRVIDELPDAIETFACPGALFSCASVAFPGDYGEARSRALAELCRPHRPIQTRDAIVALDAKIAEIGTRTGPRMDRAEAVKRWEILARCLPPAAEGAALQALADEDMRARAERVDQKRALIRAARAGDPSAMQKVAETFENGLRGIAHLSDTIFGNMSVGFEKAVGRFVDVGRQSASSNASITGAP